MTDIQHRLLNDPEIHEPKGVSTAAAGTVYTANGSGSGSWENPAVSSTNTGWVRYSNTDASSLTVTAESSLGTKVTIDRAGSGDTESVKPPLVTSSMWDTASNKFLPHAVGDVYLMALTFEVVTATSLTSATFELDTGGASVYTEQVTTVPKGAGQVITLTFPLVADSLSTANGVTIRAYKNTGAVLEIGNVSLTVVCVHKET